MLKYDSLQNYPDDVFDGTFSFWLSRQMESREVKVIYTAQSRALACLENVVHRSSKGLQNNFSLMQIFFPDDMVLQEVKEADQGLERV